MEFQQSHFTNLQNNSSHSCSAFLYSVLSQQKVFWKIVRSSPSNRHSAKLYFMIFQIRLMMLISCRKSQVFFSQKNEKFQKIKNLVTTISSRTTYPKESSNGHRGPEISIQRWGYVIFPLHGTTDRHWYHF